jgi:oxygen-dependent protoporphyrinogen oxidase
MVTDSYDGYLMDGGAQFLSSEYSILSGLIEELGIVPEYVETSRSVGVVRKGKIRKFRYDRPYSLLFGGLLSINEWLSFVIGNLRLLKKINKLPLNNFSAWKDFDNELAESWSNRYYGNTITEYFIEPLLEALYFQTPGDTSKALPIAINAFVAHSAKTMTLVSGIGKLPEVIAKKLDVRLNTFVSEVSLKSDKVLVCTTTQEFVADRVVLATPAPVSRKIYIPSNALERELLNTSYSSTVNVAIALKNKLPQEGYLNGVYGVWIPRKERKVVAAFTIETAKHCDRAMSGELIHVMLSGEAGKMMVEQDDEAILATILPELEQYLPWISGNVAFTRIYRWVNAEPKSPVGRCKKINDYRESINKNNKVILAGDYLGMPFTEGAAETGLWAALSTLDMA